MSARRTRQVAGVVVAALAVTMSSCGLISPTSRPSGPAEEDSPSPSPSPSATPLSLNQQAERSKSAVVRITATTCGGGGTGSGFLLDDRHVVTVAHVVAGAQALTVRRVDGRVARATVVGLDADREVALLELDRDLKSKRYLSLSSRKAKDLDEVVALGYPLGAPLSLTKGEVSGTDRQIDIDDGPTVKGLLQFDADISPGSSGGPLIDSSGEVVGLAEAENTGGNGLYYAVPGTTAGGLVQAWSATPDVPDGSSCPASYSAVAITSVHPDAPSVALMLERFVAGINAGEDDLTYADGSTIRGYDLAARQFTGGLRKDYPDGDELASAFAGVELSEVELEKVNNPKGLEDTADIRWTVADRSTGDTCDSRTRATLRLDSGQWQISELRGLAEDASC